MKNWYFIAPFASFSKLALLHCDILLRRQLSTIEISERSFPVEKCSLQPSNNKIDQHSITRDQANGPGGDKSLECNRLQYSVLQAKIHRPLVTGPSWIPYSQAARCCTQWHAINKTYPLARRRERQERYLIQSHFAALIARGRSIPSFHSYLLHPLRSALISATMQTAPVLRAQRAALLQISQLQTVLFSTHARICKNEDAAFLRV